MMIRTKIKNSMEKEQFFMVSHLCPTLSPLNPSFFKVKWCPTSHENKRARVRFRQSKFTTNSGKWNNQSILYLYKISTRLFKAHLIPYQLIKYPKIILVHGTPK